MNLKFSDPVRSNVCKMSRGLRINVRLAVIAAITLSGAIITSEGTAQTQRDPLKSNATVVGDMLKDAVWVKLKSEYAGLLNSSNGRMIDLPGVLSSQSLIRGGTIPLGRRGPVSQHIDISRYHTLKLESTVSLDETIDALIATGFFDVVERIPDNRPLVTPNDPSFGAQSYLSIIKATEAWDIAENEDELVIGIVDTGGDLSHPDLSPKLYIDPRDPVDGIDNDGDGYIDNNRGWDFSGDVAEQVGTSGYLGDNDPQVPKAGLFGHGTMVAGCAAAATNNGIGIASVGNRARVLFTKHYSDDQAANASNYSSNTYLGVLYAATHGARIINCSWGSYNPSTIAQDIINYVTLDLGCLVIAAAGNSNIEAPIYPASYDNVLSVGSTNNSDQRAFFSNYGRTLDLVAPGEDIYTTQYKDAYVYETGTSLSAPIVSGAAALVWARYPDYTPQQVAEQLRATSDASIYDLNPAYLYKLGHGRLDVLAALTKHTPSIRVSNQRLVNESNESPAPGETALLYLDFTNYLQPATSSLTATVSTASPYATVQQATFTIGTLGTSATRSNSADPFQIVLSPMLPLDEVIEILVTLSDGDYEDYVLLNFSIPSYAEIRENNIITSLSPNGRIGFGDPGTQRNGLGFLYNEERLLFEMGVIIGSSAADIQNNVRGVGSTYDEDFLQHEVLKKETPGQRSYSEVAGSMTSADNSLLIGYRSLVWNEDPDRDFIILEYTVKNQSTAEIQDLYFGLFADWDIADQGAHDRAGWDPDARLGYVFGMTGLQLPRTGIQVLTGQPQYRALDNDPAVTDNPFGLYDGFTDDEKFSSISGGVSRANAGVAANGGDVSHTVGAGPYTIAQGETITIAFALHAAMTQQALVNSAKRADTVYNLMLKAPVPAIGITKVCEGAGAVLKPSGASTFNLYANAIGGEPLASGSELTTGAITHDTVFYISNADEDFESLRIPAHVEVLARPSIDALSTTTFCKGESVVLDAGDGDAYSWSSGETSRTITAETTGTYLVSVEREGIFCASLNSQFVTVYELPDARFTSTPAIPVAGEVTTFAAAETDAASWSWQVDGEVAGEAPEFFYTFPEEGLYTVSLTVTNGNQCVSYSQMEVGPVTGIETVSSGLSVFPNPVTDDRLQLMLPSGVSVTLAILDITGRKLLSFHGNSEDFSFINTSSLPNGQYTLRITNGAQVIAQRFIVSR